MEYFREDHNDKILFLIRGNCHSNLYSTIESMKWDGGPSTVRILGGITEYDKMTGEEFLAYYKIDRLEILNIITEEKAKELKGLLVKRDELGEELNKLGCALDVLDGEDTKDAMEYIKEQAIKIGQELDEIDEELIKYHLFCIGDHLFNFKETIDNMIHSETYPKKRK